MMKYSVHRLNTDSDNMQEKLESFLNNLKGEIISIIPNYARTSLAQIYGVKSKIDFLLIIEKITDNKTRDNRNIFMLKA